MKHLIYLVLFVLATSFTPGTFKQEQQRFSRVRTAYQDKGKEVKELLIKHDIDINKLRIYLRAFKTEKTIELWAKNKDDQQFKRIKTFDICMSSGDIGPKRKQGDYQVPEGYYHIDRFNPVSNFFLSLGLNYPNKSDRILGYKSNLGGDIFIHGSCVTIGCMPLTDEYIKELYLYCVEAKDKGQNTIPVTVFPMQLTATNYAKLTSEHQTETQNLGLWEDLKAGYDFFNTSKTLPNIAFLPNGRHRVN